MNFSTPLGVAAVTYVLQRMLNDGLKNRNPVTPNNISISVLDAPLVSIQTPDKIKADTKDQLNLYMYMVSFNTGWRNQMQPVRNSSGTRIENTPLALDLHYLLSAYTKGDDLNRDILLGFGMQVFHDNPILSKAFIAAELAAPTPSYLSKTNLDKQVEHIKITPETLSAEEISRLWTAFGAKYRPSAAYKVTVLLTQTQRDIEPGPPVRSRNVYVKPFQQPVIEKVLWIDPVTKKPQANRIIVADDTVSIQGYNLKGEVVEVKFGENPPLPLAEVTDKQIIVSLPDYLKAGVQSVQVIHKINMGTPELPHNGPVSNAGVFMLSPKITPPTNVDFSGSPQRIFIRDINPPVQHGQKIYVLLDEIVHAPETRMPKFWQIGVPEEDLPAENTTKTSLPVLIQGIDNGTYKVRLRVDNAESA